jgi:hypothetical protein
VKEEKDNHFRTFDRNWSESKAKKRVAERKLKS